MKSSQAVPSLFQGAGVPWPANFPIGAGWGAPAPWGSREGWLFTIMCHESVAAFIA